VRAAPFTYHSPRTLADALTLYGTLEDARFLAGGQTLMPMVAMRIAQPAHLIDLNAVEGLVGIELTGGRFTIGAMTRQTALAQSELLAQHVPMLREALANVGHRATRNRGTLGGSLCHLDPAAELPVVMLALGAELTLASPDGTRILALTDFAEDALSPALAEGEMLTKIAFDAPPSGSGQAFFEVAQKFGATALVTVAACISREADGRITSARVVLGGATAVATRLRAIEAALIGQHAPMPFAQIGDELADVAFLEDPLVETAYRRKVAPILVGRAIARAFERAVRPPAHVSAGSPAAVR
jgi:carbon-monoxide dehydrogenase medium subunit